MEWKLFAVLGAYLMGALPFGFIIVKLIGGGDVRAMGSGSTGATNVTRSVGFKAGLLTYTLDVAKGAGAVLIMRMLDTDPVWTGAAALAAILGHMFPVFLKFRGGKGVATGVGAYLVMVPLAVLSTLVVWIVLFKSRRMVSLASIVATGLVPAWILLWYRLVWVWPTGFELAFIVAIGCLVVIARHYENIGRMLTGTETKFEKKERKKREKESQIDGGVSG